MKIEVKDLQAAKVGEVELLDSIFGLKPRRDILHRMVRYQLAKRQAGTHKTKGRAEIQGSTKKFVRQKGSGGARHGNRKANHCFGVVVKRLAPCRARMLASFLKKSERLALKHALSCKSRCQ